MSGAGARSYDDGSEGGSGPTVAYQGEPGAFSEEAVFACLGRDARPVPRPGFGDVADAVTRGEADFGLLPVENTLAGSVTASYDVLAATPLRILAQVVRPIRHALLGPAGATLEGLRRVLSHPVALAQCVRFLRTHPDIEAVAVHDTAGAARRVAEAGDVGQGAIAAAVAGERYGLEVLAEDLQDRDDNQTRFVLVGPREGSASIELPAGGEIRTVLLADAPDQTGALHTLLGPIARAELNLTKLEARPGPQPWTYRFFLEMEADAAEEPTASVIEEMRETADVRVLGSFPQVEPERR